VEILEARCWGESLVTEKGRLGIDHLLRLERRPDKTCIGTIEWGFDSPGYHFSPKGLAVAKETLKRFV
jgi:hypothetical protein